MKFIIRNMWFFLLSVLGFLISFMLCCIVSFLIRIKYRTDSFIVFSLTVFEEDTILHQLMSVWNISEKPWILLRGNFHVGSRKKGEFNMKKPRIIFFKITFLSFFGKGLIWAILGKTIIRYPYKKYYRKSGWFGPLWQIFFI